MNLSFCTICIIFDRLIERVVPLQIAQVQVSTTYLDVSGNYWNTLEGYNPKTALSLEFACRRPLAAGPLVAIAVTGSAIILIFLKSDSFTSRKEQLK